MYQRIVDDLKQRIAAGALTRGQRVPSTRALARRWKVANATAAHALGELARAGLIKAQPRSGYVVTGKPSAGEGELSRERIIAAATMIADDTGLAALSIRGVASKMGVPVMSLYRHVKSREELVAYMVDAALGETPLPANPPEGWRAQLELGSRLEWKMMCRHPWLAPVMNVSRPSPTPNALAFVDWVLRALDGTALSGGEKLQVHVVLHGFIQGLAVNVEAEAQAAGESGVSEAEFMRSHEERFTELAASGRYPYFAKMMRDVDEGFDMELDALFELGLRALLDGFAPAVEGRKAKGATGASARRGPSRRGR